MPIRLALLGAGLALSLAAFAIARTAAGFSFTATAPWGTTALLAAGWSLLVAALVVSYVRGRYATALVVYAVAIMWLLAEFDNPAISSSLLFTTGLVLYAACPAVVVHLGLAYPSGRLGAWTSRVVVACGYAITIVVLGAASAAVFDPAGQGCVGCADNLLLIADRPDLYDQLNLTGVRLGVVWLTAALSAITWRFLQASPARRQSVLLVSAGSLGYLSVVLVSYVASLDRGFLGGEERDAWLWLAQAALLTLIGAAVIIDVVRGRVAHRALTRLVVELGGTAPAGQLRQAIATRLGDPDLLVAYPIDGDRRHVDALANAVQLPPADGRVMTRLRYDGTEVAVLVHRPGLLDGREAAANIESALHLALENERLHAEALAEMDDLRTSGARIVAAGDEERRRIERDLHDGAQQRLVGLSLALRLLRSRTTDAGRQLDQAEALLQQTISDLRQLARGIYPVLLKDSGLAAALGALGESRRLHVEAMPRQRFDDVIESTAYLLLARASETGPTTIHAATRDNELIIVVRVEGVVGEHASVSDRVTALEGTLDVTRDAAHTRMKLSIPIVTPDADPVLAPSGRPNVETAGGVGQVPGGQKLSSALVSGSLKGTPDQ